MKNCLIIGYGWLGKPLAQALQQEGMSVHATSSQLNKSMEMEAEHISAIRLVKEEEVLGWESVPNWHFDSVVITFPPFSGVLHSIENLLTGLSFDQIIFTSSTGVYLEQNALLNESAAVDPEHRVSMMEEKIKELAPEKHVILRLAGHIGPNRHPLRYFLAKQNIISNGDSPVNLIHQCDIIGAIIECITQKVKQKTYNLCWPEHPSKRVYYGNLASEYAGVYLEFKDGIIGKKIDGSKITKELKLEYKGSIQKINPLDLRKDNI